MDHAAGPSAAAVADTFKRAVDLHSAGQLAPARALYQEIIAVAPRHAGAWQLCGVIEGQTGHYESAVVMLSRAIEIDPDNIAAYRHRVLAFKGANRLTEALADCDRVIARQPRDPAAYWESAELLRSLGRMDEALARFRTLLELKPDLADAHERCGVILTSMGRTEEALRSYQCAINLNPGHVEFFYNRAVLLQSLGQTEAALADYDTAIARQPGYAPAHFNRGLLLRKLMRREEALRDFEAALSSMSQMPEAHLNRGAVLIELGRGDEALKSLERAIELRPDYAEAYYARGRAFIDSGREEAAFDSYEQALRSKPDYVEALINSGYLLGNRLKIPEALARYDRAIELDESCAEAHFNKATLLLLTGDLAGGWVEHEWRWAYRKASASIVDGKRLAMPLWLGKESIRGKRILLHDEQGLGDAIQFCRYAPVVAQAGAEVILAVRPVLAQLMQGLDGVTHVLSTAAGSLPDCDFHCPLMSLPLAFGTTLDSIPARVPYLQCDADKLRSWRATLGESSRVRVGLVWSGGLRANEPQSWSINQRRNIALSQFAPLRQPAVEFYSLQKGEPAESELKSLTAIGWDGPPIIDLTAQLHDLTDTAALVHCLDLVITVDTSIAHLAGALGKEVWILNRLDTDWRWLLNRTDSPWYPTARIYRQTAAGQWDDVMQHVARDLNASIAAPGVRRWMRPTTS